MTHVYADTRARSYRRTSFSCGRCVAGTVIASDRIHPFAMRRAKLLWPAMCVAIFIVWRFISSTSETESKSPASPNDHAAVEQRREIFAPLRVVHLDLKGAPPKIRYLKELLPIMVAAGGNALLVEYEDVFPFDGWLANISSPSAYTKSQIREFLSLCQYYGLEVIPLVQTFGHLEYVVKLAEFADLREKRDVAQEICPSNERSLAVVGEMLRQVLRLHPNAKRVHIGCDEVFNLNVCPRCVRRRMETRDIFLDHVKSVSKMVKNQFPDVTLLMWDDMLRKWPASLISTSGLNEYVEPVIWMYGNNVIRLIPLSYWYWYLHHFRQIWIAGAFKGAADEMALLPDARQRVDNQKAWLQFIVDQPKWNSTVVGYALTGWSRYDHFAALCELLPTAVPSLVANLLLVASAAAPHANVKTAFNEILKCRPTDSWDDIVNASHWETCSYPGQRLIRFMSTLIAYRERANFLFERLYEKNPWTTVYHLQRRYTSPNKIRLWFGKHRFHEFHQNFTLFAGRLRAELRRYYGQAEADEWFQEHVALHAHKNAFLKEIFDNYTRLNSWATRNGR